MNLHAPTGRGEQARGRAMRGPDVLVIGGGVFGLSVGWAARRRGMTVRVLDAGRIGGGASGGPVGALVPHAPGRWSALHAFQLAALAALPRHVAELEAASGRPTGYARAGRLTPLGSAGARRRAEADAVAAPARWGEAGRLEILDALPAGRSGGLPRRRPRMGCCTRPSRRASIRRPISRRWRPASATP
jgi:glycine oxidase